MNICIFFSRCQILYSTNCCDLVWNRIWNRIRYPEKNVNVRIKQTRTGKIENISIKLEGSKVTDVGNSVYFQYGRKDPFAWQIVNFSDVSGHSLRRATVKPIYDYNGIEIKRPNITNKVRYTIQQSIQNPDKQAVGTGNSTKWYTGSYVFLVTLPTVCHLFHRLRLCGLSSHEHRLFRVCVDLDIKEKPFSLLKSKTFFVTLQLLSESILILGNSGVKNTRTYDENDELRGCVVTLQNFDKLIKQGEKDGTITITENTIETDKTFDI